MRFIVFLISFIFCLEGHANVQSSAFKRSNGLIRFLAEQQGLRDFALASVINRRCSRYLPSAEKTHCHAAVKKMISLMDIDIIIDPKANLTKDSWNPKSFVFVAFKNSFFQILSMPRTSIYLKDLNEKIYQYWTGELAHFSIWDHAQSFYHSRVMTAMVLAALFQDTSKMKLHLAWLESARVAGNVSFTTNKELLHRVIDTINLILDSSEDHYRELFYPEDIKRDLNRNIYHFYVPMYLSLALLKEGIHARYAYIAPLFLNLTYEFVTSAKDYRYIYSDPENILNEHTLKDIYGGYCGTNWAIRGDKYTKSFGLLRELFFHSSAEGVEFLLNH